MNYYETKRLKLRRLEVHEANLLFDYLERNRDFHQKWEPLRAEKFYTISELRSVLEMERQAFENKTSLRLYIFNKDEDRVIGTAALSGIIYGPFQSCFLGYGLDKDEINKGKMTEALEKMIEIAFNEYRLHRIEANIILANKRSIRVVQKLGFIEEGLSRKYLKINGKWEDHIHFVILNEEVE